LLAAFLALLPDDFPVAVEFRSSSWFDDDVYAALSEGGAALVVSDTGKGEPPVVRTAPFGYARLRREDYDEADLEAWAGRLAEPGWEDLFAFFKHEEAGTGPRLAARFRELVEA
jgi:uncharacterized protein YecE (DUF72 family)